MKTIKEIWDAIDSGKTVHWGNELYEVHSVKSELNEYSKHTYRDGFALRSTCVSNYFGSLLGAQDVEACFISDSKPKLKNEHQS